MKSLIVQKYDGSSLAHPEHIKAVADRIAHLHREGHPLLIIVSAMGKSTDQLVDLAYKISSTPNRRELDMLLTTGERISMALMSMALNDRGVPAISFTGSQAGVLTDDLHSNARIIDIKPVRVESELERQHVVVLAGFQGVSPRTKEVTTLGRGGSDTTAVAMAAYFKAERCEIRKDVDGVHSADPNVVPDTEHLPHLNYKSLLDMTFWGAKVLHYRSVELAELLNIPILIAPAHGDGRSTLIDGAAKMYENARILSVNSHSSVRRLHSKSSGVASAMSAFCEKLKQRSLPLPQFLDVETGLEGSSFLITAPQETLHAIQQSSAAETGFEVDPVELASVTATCQGSYASPLPNLVASKLEQNSVQIHKMIFSAMSLTVILGTADRDRAVQLIHDLIKTSI